MRRRTKVLGMVFGVLTTGVLGLGFALSRNSACVPVPSPTSDAARMRAATFTCYGAPDVLTLGQVARPTPGDSDLLIRVRAAAVNPLDWHFMRGEPYVMRLSSGFGRPKDHRIGADFAGTVEAVGRAVTRFKVGDNVFGVGNGAFADYLVIGERRAVVLMPDSTSFESAAAVGVAAITALQAVRDKGLVQPGQRVLVNGASGGVGTFAVQVAKSMGARVTGVCSTRNVDMVRGLGADDVIDYTREDFTKGAGRWDVIIDNVGNHPLGALRQVMEPRGIVVMVGGPSDDPWLGPLTRLAKAVMLSPFVSQTYAAFISQSSQEDLGVLRGLMAAGKLTTTIDRKYPLAELPAAIAYLEGGRARGKIVITMEERRRGRGVTCGP